MKACNKKSGKGCCAPRAMQGLFAPQPDQLHGGRSYALAYPLPTENPEGPLYWLSLLHEKDKF